MALINLLATAKQPLYRNITETTSVEEFFCTGNLRETAIDIFIEHRCYIFCLELKMAKIELGKKGEDEESEEQYCINGRSHRKCTL